MATAQAENILDNPNALPRIEASSRPSISFQALHEKIQGMLDGEKVHILNVDFFLILFFAISTDTLDIINLTGVGKVITIVIDIIVFFIMFLWMHWRGKRMEFAKEEARQLLQQYTSEGGRAKKATRVARTVYRRTMLRRILIKTLKRVGLTMIAEAIPFLGLVPWWTILVFLTLREKAELET